MSWKRAVHPRWPFSHRFESRAQTAVYFQTWTICTVRNPAPTRNSPHPPRPNLRYIPLDRLCAPGTALATMEHVILATAQSHYEKQGGPMTLHTPGRRRLGAALIVASVFGLATPSPAAAQVQFKPADSPAPVVTGFTGISGRTGDWSTKRHARICTNRPRADRRATAVRGRVGD